MCIPKQKGGDHCVQKMPFEAVAMCESECICQDSVVPEEGSVSCSGSFRRASHMPEAHFSGKKGYPRVQITEELAPF